MDHQSAVIYILLLQSILLPYYKLALILASICCHGSEHLWKGCKLVTCLFGVGLGAGSQLDVTCEVKNYDYMASNDNCWNFVNENTSNELRLKLPALKPK